MAIFLDSARKPIPRYPYTLDIDIYKIYTLFNIVCCIFVVDLNVLLVEKLIVDVLNESKQRFA